MLYVSEGSEALGEIMDTYLMNLKGRGDFACL